MTIMTLLSYVVLFTNPPRYLRTATSIALINYGTPFLTVSASALVILLFALKLKTIFSNPNLLKALSDLPCHPSLPSGPPPSPPLLFPPQLFTSSILSSARAVSV